MIRVTDSKAEIKRTSEGDFPYVDVGSETHGRKSFRLWVSHKLLEERNGGIFVKFPCQAVLSKTEKGSCILKPSYNFVTFRIFIKCGYRGSSGFEILSDHEACFEYREYSSPRGSCGISNGALISIKCDDLPLKIKWYRSGRLYGAAAEGISILHANGIEEELDELPDGLDAINELKKELE